MAEIEVLREFARPQPNKGRRKTIEDKTSDLLTFLRCNWNTAVGSHNKVQEVFFAFKLIAVATKNLSAGSRCGRSTC